MKYEVTIAGQLREVEIEGLGEGRFRVALEGTSRVVELLRPTPEAFHMLIDGESWEAGCVRSDGGYLVDVLGMTVQADVVDPRRKALRLADAAAGGTLATQMPGRIVKLLVPVGETVKKGQPVIVVEAMKMENEMKAPADGVLAEVYVKEGDAVDAGTKLLRIGA